MKRWMTGNTMFVLYDDGTRIRVRKLGDTTLVELENNNFKQVMYTSFEIDLNNKYLLDFISFMYEASKQGGLHEASTTEYKDK